VPPVLSLTVLAWIILTLWAMCRLFELVVVLVPPVLSLTVLAWIILTLWAMCRLFELVLVLVPPVLSLTVLADSVELVILPLLLPALVIALFNILQVRIRPVWGYYS
jgi:hypothetical protein